MSVPSPAKGLEAGAPNHVRPNLNSSQSLVPFPPLEQRQRIRTHDYHSALEPLLLEIISMPKITGAAIAFDTGNSFECVVSRGQSAPPCGTLCYHGVGLTGACLATCEIQLCNDTEHDLRVDRSACQQLGVKFRCGDTD
jgi:hypothetical protein